MTCRHVIDLIDAGPFVDSPHQDIAAARAHAQQCDRCGAALQRSESLTVRLGAMTPPASSPDFTRNVLARIATIEPRVPHAVATSSRTIDRTPQPSRAWRPALGGVALAAAIVLLTATDPIVSAVQPPSQGGAGMSMLRTPGTPRELLLGALGAMLYGFGLFAPQHRARR